MNDNEYNKTLLNLCRLNQIDDSIKEDEAEGTVETAKDITGERGNFKKAAEYKKGALAQKLNFDRPKITQKKVDDVYKDANEGLTIFDENGNEIEYPRE